MDLKTCETCGKSFSTNANYNYHISRKKPCVLYEPNIIWKFRCNRCDTKFQRKQHLNEHLHRKFPCELKNPQPEEIELRVLFDKLKKEHEQELLKLKTENERLKLQNEIKMLKGQLQTNNDIKMQTEIKLLKEQLKNKSNTTSISTNSNNNTTTNNINNKIILNMYGDETLTHLTDDFFKSCFERVKHSVERLFEHKHFSPNMPRNHNVYISNMRDNHLMIYEDGHWNIANKEITLNRMYYDTKDNLSDAYDRMCENKTLIIRLVNAFRWFVEDDIPENEENVFKKISIDTMACMAYNNRKYPMKIKKQMEERKKC